MCSKLCPYCLHYFSFACPLYYHSLFRLIVFEVSTMSFVVFMLPAHLSQYATKQLFVSVPAWSVMWLCDSNKGRFGPSIWASCFNSSSIYVGMAKLRGWNTSRTPDTRRTPDTSRTPDTRRTPDTCCTPIRCCTPGTFNRQQLLYH
jgi:hypothetical protein